MSARPLFDAYPRLSAVVEILPLCTLPTPVRALPTLGGSAYVKCDDVCHPVYGGNKLRKLELIGAEILRAKARHVITFGGTGTNAGVAAAFLCKQLQVECTVLTFEQPHSPVVEQNQAWMRSFGARIRHVGPLWATALAWSMHPARVRSDSYFLFAGCSNAVAVLAYVNAAFELREQIAVGSCPEPAEIVVATGTAATLAGLTLGCALAGLRTRVVGVRVAPARVGPVATCTVEVVARMMRRGREHIARAHPDVARVPLPAPRLLDAWYGAGYGAATAQTHAAVARAAQSDLTLDTTYSGKAFDAFLTRLPSAQGPMLFWNTYNSRPAPAQRSAPL